MHFFDIGWPSDRQKVVRTWCVLYIFTSKCASRHNAVHFFDIGTSKSGPSMVCFVHFYFEMCFAPERRALFRHLNVPKVVRAWCVLYIFTSKCASRHNGVHFCHIATSKTCPRHGVFCHFLLCKCASRHNGVYFFHISTSKSAPNPDVF